MTDKEALKMALEALEGIHPGNMTPMAEEYWNKAIAALKERLTQPEQEPVAWMYINTDGECEQIEYGEPFDDPSTTPLYTHPPQRTWVGLTKKQISKFEAWHDNREEEVGWVNPSEIVAYIEAKLKEKNT
jgi:hypothetical protein